MDFINKFMSKCMLCLQAADKYIPEIISKLFLIYTKVAIYGLAALLTASILSLSFYLYAGFYDMHNTSPINHIVVSGHLVTMFILFAPLYYLLYFTENKPFTLKQLTKAILMIVISCMFVLHLFFTFY